MIDSIPSFRYSASSKDSSNGNCVVCMSNYINREKLRRLPCNHDFHAKCIDRWLKVRSFLNKHYLITRKRKVSKIVRAQKQNYSRLPITGIPAKSDKNRIHPSQLFGLKARDHNATMLLKRQIFIFWCTNSYYCYYYYYFQNNRTCPVCREEIIES